MILVVLVVAIGLTVNLRWVRRDLERMQEEIVELHETILRMQSSSAGR